MDFILNLPFTHIETKRVHDNPLKKLNRSPELISNIFLGRMTGLRRDNLVVVFKQNFNRIDRIVEEICEIVIAEKVNIPPEVVVVVKVGTIYHKVKDR